MEAWTRVTARVQSDPSAAYQAFRDVRAPDDPVLISFHPLGSAD
jgi:hypothetical protein